MEVTCGVFLFNKYNELLIVHPTNAKWDSWSIPKGLNELGETKLHTALRECFEETNVSLYEYNLKYVGSCKYKSGKKILEAFFIKIPFDVNFEFKCTSNFLNKKTNEYCPENNLIKWASIEESFKYLHDTQKIILKEIIDEIL